LKLAVEAIEIIERDVRDYTCLLVKRERIKGKLTDYQYLNLKIRHAQRTEKAQTVPFSVYVKFLSPARYLDREVLFVEGRHHNDLIAKRGGRRNPNLTLRLDTTGPLAMEGNLYPITKIGFQNLAKQLVEVMEAELDVEGGQVEVFENAKLNGRPCRRYKVTHVEKRDGLRFHVAEVLVDKELRFPVYYASYGWPTDPDGKPRLLEQYFYTKINLNAGLTDDDFPGGGLQSPSVVEAPGGGYRIYLSMAPAGEVVGQEGGNSTVWMVGATSDDMLSWSADPAVMVEGPLHPHVMVGDDGTYTVYGGMRLDRWTSMDGRAFSDPESFDLVGMDFHVLPLPDGQLRVIKSGSGATALTGASMEIWRSLDVTWDVDFGMVQWDQQDNFIISVCVNGWASSPVQVQLMDSRGRYGPQSRWVDLEESAITVREGFLPFESTITLSSVGAPGTQEIESVVRVTQGTAGRDWHVIEHIMN
jgi:hypothetical protein